MRLLPTPWSLSSRSPFRRIIHAWAMYDWANSAYNLVITTTFFPVYFIAATQGFFGSHDTVFFGFHLANNILYDYALSFAYFIVILLTPLLSVIADRAGARFAFLYAFSLLGAISCAGLFFFTGGNVELGIIIFILSTIGYGGGVIFYNAYLPHIVPAYLQDKISGMGFSYGYVGSVLLQIIGFVLLLTRPFGISEGFAIRITFLLVGVWWAGFSIYALRYLKHSTQARKTTKKKSLSFQKNKTLLQSIMRIAWRKREVRDFLFAYFCYNMGAETLMLIAINFGQKELGISSTRLVSTAVALQLIAVVGTLLIEKLRRKIGSRASLIVLCIAWTLICVGGYYVTSEMGFYVLSVFVGLIMGATQSLSRSTYSKSIPYAAQSSTFFTLYDMIRSVGIVLGMFTFGFIEQQSGSIRLSILFLAILFALGALLLLWYRYRARKIYKPTRL